MKSWLISLGQASVHSPWLVHEPKNCSIVSTIASARLNRSDWPWGSELRCHTLAEVNSWAAELGHAATHAPHPMQAAASMAESATLLGDGDLVGVGGGPGGGADVAAGLDDLVER